MALNDVSQAEAARSLFTENDVHVSHVRVVQGSNRIAGLGFEERFDCAGWVVIKLAEDRPVRASL
jgi:hypothetical protein